jgi:hypothetical protein
MKKNKKKDVRLLFLRNIDPEVHAFIKRIARDQGYPESTVVNRVFRHVMEKRETGML